MIGISPAKLDFNLKKSETAAQKIFLQNLDEHSTKVAVSLTSSRYQNQVAINPEELILPPRQIQEIEIKVKGEKSFKAELEILSLAQTNSELNIASGVKLPLEVKVENSFAFWPLLLAIGLAAAATVIIYLLQRRSRSLLRGAKRGS